MILSVEVPEDLSIKEMLKRKDIPCFCKVNTKSLLVFDFDPFLLEGKILEWDARKMNLLYPSLVGGDHTYYNHALVSIDKISENNYKISNLKFFESTLGWCPIIVDGEYAPEPEYDEDF